MDKRAEETAKEEQRNLLEIQKKATIALKNSFKNITSLKFEENPDENKMTGSYGLVLTMTNKEGKSTTFFAIYIKGKEELESYIIEDENVQIKGETKDVIQVIFYNGETDRV